LGTPYSNRPIGYYRSIIFATGYSIHGLLGVQPQKLSGILDRLFPLLMPILQGGPRFGLQVLNGRLCLVCLFAFTDPTTGASRSELVCFDEGKLFLCRTPDLGGHRILDLVTLTIRTAPEVYGIDDAGRCYRIFARLTDTQQGTLTVSSKLFDFEQPVEGHQGIQIGFDLSAPNTTDLALLTVTATTEAKTIQVSANYENFNSVKDSPLGRRYALYRYNLPMIGQRMGWTLQVPCATGVCLEAGHQNIKKAGEWEAVDPQPSLVDWIDANGNVVYFADANADLIHWLAAATT